MIIIFSVFNGLESVVKDRDKGFYPDIKVSVIKGKFFPLNTARLDSIKHTSGVKSATCVIEDNVLAISNNQKIVITLKGISGNFLSVNDIQDYIVGDDTVSAANHTAIGGRRIINELGADINNGFSTIEFYYPNTKITDIENNIAEASQSLKLHPSGAFAIDDEFDGKYVLAPLPLAQELFREQGYYSSVELRVEESDLKDVEERLQKMFGAGYRVETRDEQNRTVYRIMSTEKWAVVVILVLVLLIASFNMVGALSMLVLEKQKDIAILKAMGAFPTTIRLIFLLEGMLWALTGGLSGIILGLGVCLIQIKFGLVKLAGNFIVDAYPVKIQAHDIILVVGIIMGVGLLTSWYPAMRATKATDPTLKSA